MDNKEDGTNNSIDREPITFTDDDIKQAEKILSETKSKLGVNDQYTRYEGNNLRPDSPFPRNTKKINNERTKSNINSIKFIKNPYLNNLSTQRNINEEPKLFKSLGSFFKGLYTDLKNERIANMTDYSADATRASELGFELRESKLDKLSGKLTGRASPRYEAVNQMNGKSISIDGISKLSDGEINTWKEGHIYDYAKNQAPDSPIDIFTENKYSDSDKDLYNSRNESYKESLKEIEELQKDPSSLSESTARTLEANKKELKERISAYETPGINNKNIPSERIVPTEEYKGPRVRESVRDNQRVAGQTFLKNKYGKERFGHTSNSFFSHRVDHGQEGGFGLGFSESMKASRGKHFSRFLQFSTTKYGSSTLQGLKEGAAILNKHQAIQFKTAGFGGRMMLGLGSALPTVSILKDIYDNDSTSDIAKDYLSNVGFMNGWRKGAALGGAITKEATFMRAAALGLGGASGALLGSAIWSGAVDLVSDVTSNQSKIRNFSRNLASKEMYASGEMTNKALTMRQAGLQKLARSGLNDRGLLLGNEASILAGAM